MESTSQMKIARFQDFWIQMRKNKPLDESCQTSQTSGTKMAFYSKATNWAKFSATAGLGVIHRGHLQQGRSLMAPYLPQSGSGGGSPYSEGGALYALGLINANHGGGSGSNSGESITAPGGG
ncbi:putative armadillo-like helical protein [Helianthus anomalus]